MNCIVTAGPTYEPLDQVRRLTNFSSGKLGTMLANYLVARGHHVTLLKGHYSTFQGEQTAQEMQIFTTTQDLQDRLKAAGSTKVDALFHAAAVSDFGFGKILEQQNETFAEIKSGKVSTRGGKLFAELVPTPKILPQLRGWFPQARIVGWKYEVDGNREDAIARAKKQIVDGNTNACVANGPAYGFGFGLVTSTNETHLPDLNELFAALEVVAANR